MPLEKARNNWFRHDAPCFHRWTGVACTLRIIQVDMSQKLTELGLIDLMPAQIWPPMCAVRELATRIKRNSKGCQCQLCVAVDLRK